MRKCSRSTLRYMSSNIKAQWCLTSDTPSDTMGNNMCIDMMYLSKEKITERLISKHCSCCCSCCTAAIKGAYTLHYIRCEPSLLSTIKNGSLCEPIR